MQYLSNYRLYFLVDNNGYFGIFPGYFGNRRLVRYFGSYSGISVIPVNLVNRRRVIVVPGSIAVFLQWLGFILVIREMATNDCIIGLNEIATLREHIVIIQILYVTHTYTTLIACFPAVCFKTLTWIRCWKMSE